MPADEPTPNSKDVPARSEVWEHPESGNRYAILDLSFNSITKQIDVLYAPLYDSQYTMFNRQLMKHEKAWLSPKENGQPRFVRISRGGLAVFDDGLSEDEIRRYRALRFI